MRLGYSYWGFLGDIKLDRDGNPLSTPDGNATYSWSIFWEAQRRGWETYRMMPDRDRPASLSHDTAAMFGAFSREKRADSYLESLNVDYDLRCLLPVYPLPELDVLLLEWRFPIPGRNTDLDISDPNFQPDLLLQMQMLNHYRSKNTKIIIWDLDHKVTVDDEVKWAPDAIFETSVSPRRLIYQRTRVEPPTVVGDLLQHEMWAPFNDRKMVYVGSRYERDDVIEEFLAPVAKKIPGQIEFWGNWTQEKNFSECLAKWPNFKYNGRITTKDFRTVYGTAVSCPLLAKRSYIETGFITPRPWEALLFGTIPLGITQMNGIHDYVHWSGSCADEFAEYVDFLSSLELAGRERIRKTNVEQIEFMDARHFIDRVEEVVDGKNRRRPVEEPRL